MIRVAFAVVAVLAAAAPAYAGPCLNKFLARSEGPRQVVTLLTGWLTFDEARALAVAISERQAPALEWVDERGKTVSRQFGELKVVRPMPVGCDDKPSGVVMIATFPGVRKPSQSMFVKLDPKTTVEFVEQ
ncbi:MAG TPA: hypothetical protein VM779_03095 [Thermoanaerobaculia bacterium]|nr:hypothetical protein [Thermoanaerobaculia bacterium]